MSTEIEVMSKARLPDLADLDAAEAALLDMPQIECPTAHHFGPGVYIREVVMPAGSLVMGHHHKGPCMNMLVKGSMLIIDPDSKPRRIDAPLIFTTGPGRKVAYMLEDVVFQNIFATEETDVEKLEDQLIEKSETWLSKQDAANQIDVLTAHIEEQA